MSYHNECLWDPHGGQRESRASFELDTLSANRTTFPVCPVLLLFFLSLVVSRMNRRQFLGGNCSLVGKGISYSKTEWVLCWEASSTHLQPQDSGGRGLSRQISEFKVNQDNIVRPCLKKVKKSSESQVQRYVPMMVTCGWWRVRSSRLAFAVL